MSNNSSAIEHNLEYGLKNPRCYYCDEEIWFHPDFAHDSGTPIPLDIDRDESGQIAEHLCLPRRQKMLQRSFKPCYRCGKQITFDSSRKSRNGKLIPCEYNEQINKLLAHNCKKSVGYRHTVAQRHRPVASSIPKSYEDTLLKEQAREWAFKEQWK